MELSSQVIWQGVLNGLALGWVYILMALGLTLIFGIMNIMQFAHGEVYMLGAFIVYYLSHSYGVNIYAAMPISMAAMAAFGLFLEKFFFRRFRGQMLPPIIVSIGLILILQSSAAVAFGIDAKSIPTLALGSFNIFGSAVPKDRIVAVAFAVALLLVLYIFLNRSKYGQAMVASAQNPQGAILQGISPNQMSAASMAIGCALAAAGGALAGSIFTLTPYMGTLPLVKGLIIIVLGGMGSLLGVVVGGIILGTIDGIVPITLGPGLASIAPLVIVVIILLLRPQGLFGHE